MSKKKEEETTQSSFTIDNDSEVPSVTKLLNRKSLGLVSAKKTPEKKEITLPPKAEAQVTPSAPTPGASLDLQPSIEPLSSEGTPDLSIHLAPILETSSSAEATGGSFSLESPLGDISTPSVSPETPVQQPTSAPSLDLSAPVDSNTDSSRSSDLSLQPAIGETTYSSAGAAISMGPAIGEETSSDNVGEISLGPAIGETSSAAIALSLESPLGEVAPAVAIPTPTRLETTDSAASHKIQRTRRRVDPGPKLIVWTMEQIQKGADPMGKGIHLAIQKGANSALFLSIAPNPSGNGIPLFVATSVVQGKEKIPFWNGLKWNPTVVPEMWNYFVKSGQVELTPPGLNTNQNSNRNVVRAAFGISKTEYLLLVRAGPPKGCRGVIALVSEKSLIIEINEAIHLITSLPKKIA